MIVTKTKHQRAWCLLALSSCGLLPVPCEAQSNIAPVVGSISSATTGASFTPVPSRPFNITISGAWAGSWQLERELGGSWYAVTVTAAGATTQMEYGAANASEIWLEPEPGVPYRLDMSSTVAGGGWVSGTLSYRFDQ